VLVVGPVGVHEREQLDLLELVHPQDPAGVLAVRASLATEARRVPGVTDRQVGGVEELVHVQGGERDLGRPDEVEVVVAGEEQLLLVGREEAGAVHGRLAHQHRGDHRHVAVPAGDVDRVADQRELEQRPLALEVGEAGARHLGATREVDGPGGLEQVDVVARLEVEVGLVPMVRSTTPSPSTPSGASGCGRFGTAANARAWSASAAASWSSSSATRAFMALARSISAGRSSARPCRWSARRCPGRRGPGRPRRRATVAVRRGRGGGRGRHGRTLGGPARWPRRRGRLGAGVDRSCRRLTRPPDHAGMGPCACLPTTSRHLRRRGRASSPPQRSRREPPCRSRPSRRAPGPAALARARRRVGSATTRSRASSCSTSPAPAPRTSRSCPTATS
jgi:hypothetical protein